MKRIWRAILAFLQFVLMSPLGWAIEGGIILLAFAILHWLGWRDDTRIIVGEVDFTTRTGLLAIFRGLSYGGSYFAAVIAAPIMLLASLLLGLALRVYRFRAQRKA